MAEIGRRSLVLLLLGVDPERGVCNGMGGITRLQKFIFLLEQQQGITPTGEGFDFTKYKAGPYSARVYDDLELLENLGLVETQVTSEATEEEAAELDMLDFEELVPDGAEHADGQDFDGFGAADAYQERRFRLTREGRQRVTSLMKREDYQPIVDAIRNIKSKYGRYSLSDLLYLVYTKYPGWTTESEIKEKILRKRRRP